MKKYIMIITFIFYACAVNVNYLKGQSSLKKRAFHFSYIVELPSTDGRKMEMWIPIPKSNEVQKIANLKIDTQDIFYEVLSEKEHRNSYMYLHESEGTKTQKTIKIEFDVNRKEHKEVNFKNVNPENYLSDYTMVPVGGVFEKIISDNNLSHSNYHDIYDFILSGMHYGKPKSIDNQYYSSPWLFAEEKYGLKQVSRDDIVNLYQKSETDGGDYTFGKGNAIYACDIGVGNCTDYHSYFLSINRTMDIPARFHMGFPIPDGNQGEIKGYHCWADYFVEGIGWFPVDISEADKHPKKTDYYFGTIDENRIEFIIGRDLRLNGLEIERTNLFIYPILEINDKISTAFSKKFTYKNL